MAVNLALAQSIVDAVQKISSFVREIPPEGKYNDFLVSNARDNNPYDVAWQTIELVPANGESGQVLTRGSNNTLTWTDQAGGNIVSLFGISDLAMLIEMLASNYNWNAFIEVHLNDATTYDGFNQKIQEDITSGSTNIIIPVINTLDLYSEYYLYNVNQIEMITIDHVEKDAAANTLKIVTVAPIGSSYSKETTYLIKSTFTNLSSATAEDSSVSKYLTWAPNFVFNGILANTAENVEWNVNVATIQNVKVYNEGILDSNGYLTLKISG